MGFHWSLSNSKSPQVSRTLLSILSSLDDVVAWMVSTRPLISKSSSSSTNPFVTVQRTPITIGITVILMFHSFFLSLARSRYLLLVTFLVFTLWSARTAKSTIWQLLFFFGWISLSLVIWSRLLLLKLLSLSLLLLTIFSFILILVE